MAQANTVQAHRDAANEAFEKAQDHYRLTGGRMSDHVVMHMQIAQFHATMATSAKD